jgi:hypothetical protein
VRQFKKVFNENETGQTQNMTGKGYTIRMDGTAEICIGGIEIKGISPFVNDAPFLPFSVSASSDEISFTLSICIGSASVYR